MRRRPKPIYLRKMHKEDPDSKERKLLISGYRRGGLKKFEDDVKKYMGNINIEQVIWTDPETRELLKWVYVGNFWWCRKRKNIYEFARMMAIKNRKDVTEYIGLWDSRKHDHKEPPIIINHSISGRSGVIVEYNEYEIWINWSDDNSRGVIRDIKLLNFEFEEDFKKFNKLLKGF